MPGGLGQSETKALTFVHSGFLVLYALSHLGTCLRFIALLAVTLALKVNDFVGADAARSSLAVVVGVGSLVALVSNPLCGRLSDRTSSRRGTRRPRMVGGLLGGTAGILVVAMAPNVRAVLLG